MQSTRPCRPNLQRRASSTSLENRTPAEGSRWRDKRPAVGETRGPIGVPSAELSPGWLLNSRAALIPEAPRGGKTIQVLRGRKACRGVAKECLFIISKNGVQLKQSRVFSADIQYAEGAMTECYLLFHRHVAFSFDKQLQLADLIGDRNWSFNKPTGLLSFGDRYQWRVQTLGTEAYDRNTWLWSWANLGSNIPSAQLEASLAMKILGEDQAITEFTTPELPLGEINGHMLSLIASGVFEANGYYRGPYTGGAAFFLIKDENFPKRDVLPLARIVSVFPQAISAMEIKNHKLAFLGYVEDYGLVAEEKRNGVVVKEDGSPVLRASFDEQNRLTKLEGSVGDKGN